MKKLFTMILLCVMAAMLAAGVYAAPDAQTVTVEKADEGSVLPAAPSAEAAVAEEPETVTVSFLGPEGTYTEEAAQFWFQDGEQLLPKNTVNEAIADLLTGGAEYAVIPQENTLGGAVVNYVDALIAAEDAYVVGEVVLPISQTLMGVPGASLEDITTVCSHSQGLTQSAQWRAENLPDAVTEEMSSTAA
ncbi:MAG: hypothetical protein IKP86_12790, partial [Anaerolineaceae bacterium]|nr:hypothetical protein [Anaerolineaceae bacterium]